MDIWVTPIVSLLPSQLACSTSYLISPTDRVCLISKRITLVFQHFSLSIALLPFEYHPYPMLAQSFFRVQPGLYSPAQCLRPNGYSFSAEPISVAAAPLLSVESVTAWPTNLVVCSSMAIFNFHLLELSSASCFKRQAFDALWVYDCATYQCSLLPSHFSPPTNRRANAKLWRFGRCAS